MGVDFPDTAAAPGNQAVVTTKQFFKVSPGFAYRVNDRLAIGATINLDYQSLALSNPAYSLPQNQVFGWGVSAGLVWKFADSLQTGSSLVEPQNMERLRVEHDAAGKFSMGMDAPQTLALGLAWRPAPAWLIEGDVKRIWFGDVLDRVTINRPSGYTGPIPAALHFRLERPDGLRTGTAEGHRRSDAGAASATTTASRRSGRRTSIATSAPWRSSSSIWRSA